VEITTHGKRPSKDRAEPVSAGIPQMNRHFWPKRQGNPGLAARDQA